MTLLSSPADYRRNSHRFALRTRLRFRPPCPYKTAALLALALLFQHRDVNPKIGSMTLLSSPADYRQNSHRFALRTRLRFRPPCPYKTAALLTFTAPRGHGRRRRRHHWRRKAATVISTRRPGNFPAALRRHILLQRLPGASADVADDTIGAGKQPPSFRHGGPKIFRQRYGGEFHHCSYMAMEMALFY